MKSDLSSIEITKNKRILEIMHQFANQLMEVTEEQEIYQIQSAAMSQLIPGVFSIITKLQPNDMNFRIMGSSGFENYFGMIEKLIGKDPHTIDFPFQDLTEEEQRQFNARILYHFKEGIFELVHGRISKLICKAIEKMLDISDVYGMGFSVENKYFGGIVLFITKPMKLSGAVTDEVKLAIENIANQASTLIQRLRDRDALKKNEEILQNANLQIETLIENSSSGYLFEDSNRKIIKVNKALCNLLKIPDPDLIIGMYCNGVYNEYSGLFDNPQKFVADIEKLFAENKAVFNEELHLKDGRVFERDFVPIRNSTITGYLWQYRDISIRKMNEKKLQEQTALLHELNQTKDKFFTIIAHDLKGPFGSILGITELLVKEYDSLTEEDRIESIRLLDRSSHNTYKLVENLLEWARLQRGNVDVKKEKLFLKDLVNESVEPCLTSAAKKDQTVVINIKENFDVIADENSIKTIIRNLLNNAIKYTPNGGLIHVDAIQNGQLIEVSIQDNGIGMSLAIKEKLFRIEESQSRMGTNNEVGTGLGLILCKDIIAKNGGKIWVESELGKGSIFTFSIPLN
ncbi:MAG: PAS domain-containing sensor histidine kinase [Prolixibacteraceae bacterium]